MLIVGDPYILSVSNKPFMLCHHAECRYTRCRKAECRYAECHYAECRYAECHYAECRYAECRRAVSQAEKLFKDKHSSLSRISDEEKVE